MKTHQDFIDAEEAPRLGEVFDFHGMRVKAVSDHDVGCDKCIKNAKNIDRGCELLPMCGSITFVYEGMNDAKRFKVWRVIQRIDKANGV